MKKHFGLALLALPLLALPARATDPFAPHFPYRVETGANVYFRVLSNENGFGAQLGPWYNYWPMEAHFQTPALPYYPYWPAPQTLVPGGTGGALPYNLPAIPTAAPAAPSGLQPAYYRANAYEAYRYYANGR